MKKLSKWLAIVGMGTTLLFSGCGFRAVTKETFNAALGGFSGAVEDAVNAVVDDLLADALSGEEE